MYSINIDIAWLILILMVINLLAVTLIRSHDRFWIPPVILWLFLFFAWIVIREENKRIIEYKEITITEPSQNIRNQYTTNEIEENKNENREVSLTLLRLLGLESIFGFLLQGIGYRTTNKTYYKKSLISFLVLTVVYVITEIVILTNRTEGVR